MIWRGLPCALNLRRLPDANAKNAEPITSFESAPLDALLQTIGETFTL
jgi:hypothetical protein